MLKYNLSSLFLFLVCSWSVSQSQQVFDDFEGNGTIPAWYGDDCNLNPEESNPYAEGINTSAGVLKYEDVGGQYANVRFQLDNNFDLIEDHVFTMKIYVPSSGVTGNQPNQISMKLQNGNLDSPWITQCEIVKPMVLDAWQTVEFNWLDDNVLYFDQATAPAVERTDINRVLIQLNGENNNDLVTAFIDDVYYNGEVEFDVSYDYLVWSDEFDGEGAVNDLNWHHQTILPDGNSWFNNEVQHYTNELANSNVSNGQLNLTAIKENYTSQGVTKEYTSARLNSKFAFTYGRVEVRAKLPEGGGTWPAIWMLGKNINEYGAYWQQQGFGTTGWPECGEIDIMEHWGFNQNYVQSATHTPSSFGATENHGGQMVSSASSAFHVYSVEWFPEKLVFKVDGNTHFVYEPEVQNDATWPFYEDQYILLNFAIQAEISSSFTSDAMEVDYVRVYQSAPVVSVSEEIKDGFKLQNAPNPSVDLTVFSYELASASQVKLYITDQSGRLVEELIQENQEAGSHQVNWNTSEVSSGLYFYTLETPRGSMTRQCVVQR